ncbi:MAG TPA: chemotaxis response regulator protein-glutamate methylesterase [Polyangiaceae bacterium]|jgi:two-component system chemotaxis response regulator CheB|nr:chemotaxis response regulator protein-glutamate methylesterase [Polyangiaceae bacterium]
MPRVRVLVVDDSVVVRRLVTDALSSDARCEVVGSAANGKIALAKISQVNPDIVTMDIEMPEMDGLECLAALRKLYPKLPVIMFSTLTERAAAATLKALSLGATDYVAKPSAGGIEAAQQMVREQLLPKVLQFGSPAGLPRVLRPTPAPAVRSAAAKPLQPVRLLAIGCSTGGPNALTALLERFPARLPVPVVITQHMPPVFTRLLAERLRAHTRLPVSEAQGGEVLAPGDIWIAPGDHHLVLRRDGAAIKLALDDGPHENSCRPAVDVMFRSVVQIYGGHVLALIMTGMGQDGLRGCEHVREAGGQIVVQDEATSVVWGMPGYVAQAGLADAILPLAQLAPELTRRMPGAAPPATAAKAAVAPQAASASHHPVRSKSIPCP